MLYRFNKIPFNYIFKCLFHFCICILCILFVIIFIVRPFMFDQFVIPSLSMYPTLQIGDHILVNKMIIGPRIYTNFNFSKANVHFKSVRFRGYRRIQPNDILIFNMPYDDYDTGAGISFAINRDFCKRCLGVPGNKIGCKQGVYYNESIKDFVGGNIKMQSYLAKRNVKFILKNSRITFPKDVHFSWNIKNFGPIYVPRKGDLIQMTPYEATLYKYVIEWEQGRKLKIDWKRDCVYIEHNQIMKYKFKHNYYFMIGDNVENSVDSRYWGFVPEEFIIGVVSRITYSMDPTGNKLIFTRLWKKL